MTVKAFAYQTLADYQRLIGLWYARLQQLETLGSTHDLEMIRGWITEYELVDELLRRVVLQP